VRGESGTGKELVANSIHYNSLRAKGPFVKVNCAALPANLIESELFGHEKGAFTNAMDQKAGRFELASGGTLFMDEIGNLDMRLQTKILSALQNREICRVGGSRPIPVDIRLICATNRDLVSMVKDGQFREDLFYRINMFEIEIPPLRERPDDIPLLVRHYLDVFSRHYNKTGLELSASVSEKLKKYPWPGNVRELKNSVERAVILETGGQISAESVFPQHPPQTKDTLRRDYRLTENEKRLIMEVIEKNRGNMTQSARDLGIERTALYRRLKKYGL
jgi:transcriptional regulator with PAS, ATPase and Fis domain